VAICKKKVVAYLLIIALGSGAPHQLFAEQHLSPTLQPLNEPDRSIGAGFANDPNFSTRAESNLGSSELFFRLMLSVLLVAALGVAAIYASRKLLPRITNLPGKKIHIIETVHLGPRKAVHLLEIGNQRFLIGSTNENITKLADVTYALAELSPKEADDNGGIYDR
jgi:flagellar biogenesis protein FliO